MSVERKVLVRAEAVHRQSLPYSLRHISPACALEDAKSIAWMLQDFIDHMGNADMGLLVGTHRGISLVFGLLQDKLMIASGDYKFPCMAYNDDEAPALVDFQE